MKFFDTIFHLLTGGLEFLEISAKLKPGFKIEYIESALKEFAKKNGIHIFIVKEMPKYVIGKDIYIKYNPKTHCILLKALHSYYDGISMTRFFIEIDKIYQGEHQDTVFKFKSPIESYYGNKCVELGANILMNKINEEYDENAESKPYDIYSDITSGDLIRAVHKKADMDMILLLSKSKMDKNDDASELKNNLTFRYVKKGEDFKTALQESGNFDQGLRFTAWLAKKSRVLFFNNLSNMKLPSFIEKLVCNENADKKTYSSRLLTLVAYPRTSAGTIEVYKS
jgi:hypothetical protein